MITTVWTLDGWSAYGGADIVPDADGVEWLVTDEDWRSGPTVRAVSDDRPRADGGLSGEVVRAARVIELGGTVIAPDTPRLVAAMRRFAALMPDGRVLYPLAVTELDETLFTLVGLPAGERPEIAPVAPTAAEWHLTLRAPDDRKYTLVERSVSTGLPASMGGMEVPVTVPIMIASSGSSGRVSALNNGTVSTNPTITINGPVLNPRVDFVSTGQTLRFALDLADGHFIQVDTRKGAVLLDGTVNRANTVTGSPVADITLPPGQSTEITFRAQSSLGGASVVVSWRDAYL